MTDARFPEAWLNDRRVVRLSDGAFRLFVTTLAWSASNRTDGELEHDDLEMLHGVQSKHAGDLVTAGLWISVAGGFRVADFAKTQSTRAQLEGLDHKREQDRERKARQRARERGAVDIEPEVSRVTSDVTARVTQRTGQDRQGQAGTKAGDPRFWKQPDEMEAETFCEVCGLELNPALARGGETTHPGCAA